jgi:hypothetical protein
MPKKPLALVGVYVLENVESDDVVECPIGHVQRRGVSDYEISTGNLGRRRLYVQVSDPVFWQQASKKAVFVRTDFENRYLATAIDRRTNEGGSDAVALELVERNR